MDVNVAYAPAERLKPNSARRPPSPFREHGAYYHALPLATALAMLAMASVMPFRAAAQTATPINSAPTTSLAPLGDGWEQIDERLVFLTVRLSSDEASLAAVNKAIKQTGYQQTVKNDAADSYRHGNEIMDRKGGGPKPWDEFYGRTAEKFFYHPVDPNTSYINPLPISQRPPQLDYIYRANTDEQQRAENEAAALGGKIDKLLDRRRRLEAEQSALWCEIAFQAIASQDLPMKPLYRFDLRTADTDSEATDHLGAARAACDFVRAADQLMDDAQRAVESNQQQVFQQLPAAVATARKSLVDRLSQQESLTLDLGDSRSPVGKVAACAKRLNDLAANILDSYRLAADGEQAGDDQRKDTFRGLLQDQLLSSAETLYTMGQCVLELARGWKLVPDVKKPAPAPTAHLDIMPTKDSGASPQVDGSAPTFPNPTAPGPTSPQMPGAATDGSSDVTRSAPPAPPSSNSAQAAGAAGLPAAAAKEETADRTGPVSIADIFAQIDLPGMTDTNAKNLLWHQIAGTSWSFQGWQNHHLYYLADGTIQADTWHGATGHWLAVNGDTILQMEPTAQALITFDTNRRHASWGYLPEKSGRYRFSALSVRDQPDLSPPVLRSQQSASGDGSAPITPSTDAPVVIPQGITATAAANAELSGEQTEPVLVLAPREQPYVLSGDYDVPVGKRLEIRAGTTIVGSSRSQLTVHGELICAGTRDQPVIFCGAQHSSAWWKGLVLDGAAGSTLTGSRFMDAELGVHVFRCNPTFNHCVFVNNRIGLSIGQLSGYGGGTHAATLNDCVCSFNTAQGILVHGGTATLSGCTVTKNGGWGVDGAYYVTHDIKNSIISLNHGGGIILAAYDCKATAENSVLAGNTGLDLQNKSTPECDLRGNYWGPALTQYFAGGGQSPPNIKGPARFEVFLPEMPKQCGASIRELGGQSLW